MTPKRAEAAVDLASSGGCCRAPARVACPIDSILSIHDLRLRHLPGSICLRCGDFSVPELEPSDSLIEAVAGCLAGDSGGATVLKARARDERATPTACGSCGQSLEPAWLDIGFGGAAGLVVENVAGAWCWTCDIATIPDDGAEVYVRLQRFDPDIAGTLQPSLLYDTPAHPASVQFEVSTRCNLRCAYCTNPLLPSRHDLSFSRFLELADRIDFRVVDNVDFTGLGEPVLNAGLPRMVQEIWKRGAPTDVRVVTNGTIMTPERFEPLCDAGVTSIAFSIDSLDPVRFARSRGGAQLGRVLEHLEALVAYRTAHQLDRLKVKIKAVMVDDSYEDAERLLVYSAGLGIDMPHFSRVDMRAVARKQYREPWLLKDPWADGGASFVEWSSARWAELVGDRTPQQSPAYPSPAQRAGGYIHPGLAGSLDVCRWAINAAFVTSSGTSLSCCEQMIDLPRVEYASLDAAPMRELWNGPLFWSYRLPLSLGRLPDGCVGCSWAPLGAQPFDPALIEIGLPQTDRTSR
jgi:pyruvate-formate lyase-activating enzyme